MAIILVNWNSYEVTHDCILSLQHITYPNYVIIVVDNASQDGSGKKIEQEHSDIIVLYSSKNSGFTGGNNIGFRYSLEHGFEYSLMLNNDTFVEPDFLNHLVYYLSQHPDTAAVQPRIYLNHNRQLLWNGGSYLNRWLGYMYTKGENKLPEPEHLITKEVDWITGCAFLVRNSILKETGLLAENMFMYSEDVDLSFRIKEKGHSLMYIPESIIYHIAGMSNKSKVKGKEGFVNPIVHYLNQRNRIWLLKRYTKWQYVPSVLLFNFFYVMMVMGYFAARGRFRKLKAMLNAIKDGLLKSIKYE